MAEINREDLKELEKYRKISAVARNIIGTTTPEPSLLAVMIYLLDNMNAKMDKIVEVLEKSASTKVTPAPIETPATPVVEKPAKTAK